MAAVSPAPTTTSASLNKYWRKVQGPLAEFAFAHGKRTEKKFYDSLQATPMEWSAYENTFPVDLNERGGIASLADSGSLAVASSVNAIEGTVSAVHFNGRFSISDQGRWADAGQRNQIKRQIQAQAGQKMDAMVEHFSDYFWGFPTALLATTNSDLSSATPTLTFSTGFGQSAITNPKYIASMFKVGERFALADGSDALINANAFGKITAVDKTNGTVTMLLDGSVTYSTDNIRFYKANNGEGVTMAGGTDLNRGLNGLFELYTSTSVHNISGSANPNWTAAFSSTSVGRFTPNRLRRAMNDIENDSSLTLDFAFIAQGVYRDMILQERAGLRYDSDAGMTFDGDVKAKNVQFMTPKGCPPGYVFLGAKAALRKWEILPVDGDASYGELQKYQDYAASFGRVDWFGNMFAVSRKGLAWLSNQQES